MADTLQKIASNLYDGEDKEVAELVQQALDQGMPPNEVLQRGLIAGMDEVGRDFKAGDLFKAQGKCFVLATRCPCQVKDFLPVSIVIEIRVVFQKFGKKGLTLC